MDKCERGGGRFGGMKCKKKSKMCKASLASTSSGRNLPKIREFLETPGVILSNQKIENGAVQIPKTLLEKFRNITVVIKDNQRQVVK